MASLDGMAQETESDLSDDERERKNDQMEGFMLLYEMFRPLTKNYLD